MAVKSPASTPLPLVVAGGVLAVQALAAVIAGVAVVIEALTGSPHNQGTAVFLGFLTILGGVAIGYAARGVFQARPWATTPTWLAEFVAFIVGLSLLQGKARFPGLWVALIMSAIVTVAATLHPAARAVLIDSRSRSTAE